MNTNVVISLDIRRAKKDGTFPLVMRLGHNARTTSIPLDIDLHKADWDETKRLVKKSYVGSNSVSRINNLLQKNKADAMDVILRLQEAGQLEAMSLMELRSKIVKQDSVLLFCAYTSQLVEELRSTNQIGTARSYKGVVDVIKTFHGGKDIAFKAINYKFLTRFEQQHLAKGNSYNGLSVYLRAIRAIYNKAIKAGIAEKEDYPFDDYKIKTVPTEKRALQSDFIKAIISIDLPVGHTCFNARNYFIASFIMYGMNFTDMAFLKNENVKDGRIQYRRRKTSKLYDIKITPNLEAILNHYKQQKPNGSYIFPILKTETLSQQYKEIQWARKRYNSKLKDLAKLCSIEQNLTSYVSRHSFATQAMLQQIPLNAISSMLGHSSLKTTEIYLKSLPSSILDDYNSMIIGKL